MPKNGELPPGGSRVILSGMAVHGYVVQTFSSRGGFKASSINGDDLGEHKSPGEAQTIIERNANGGRPLKWTRSDRPGGIEAYIGEDP